MRPGFLRAAALFMTLAAAGCSSKSSPTTPTPSATHASVSITSITVSGSRAVEGGYGYRVVLHLRESGGMAATIKSVDLTFMDGSNAIVTSHFEQVIPATGNVTPANGVADTRELVATDANLTHPYAGSVNARVTFTDSTTVESTVTGSAAVPALNEPPPPTTYTLRGIITEQGTDRGIEGARVEALNGANAGKATLTDAAGAYTLTSLSAETFRMRASMAGFDSGEQNVTVPDTNRADLALRRTASATCAYSITPSGAVDVSFPAGQFAFTITRTSGSCSWQASTNVSWISLGASSGGGDTATSFSYQPNTLFVGRLGVITVEWNGGNAQLTVRQGPESPAFCRIVSVTVAGGGTIVTAPAGGGTFSATITPEAGTPPGACGNWNANSGPEITFPGGLNFGPTPGTVSFTVTPNASTTPRTLSLSLSIAGRAIGIVTINQSGS
jgi:hypothetical protein